MFRKVISFIYKKIYFGDRVPLRSKAKSNKQRVDFDSFYLKKPKLLFKYTNKKLEFDTEDQVLLTFLFVGCKVFIFK